MSKRSISVELKAEVSQYKRDLEAASKATEKLAVSQELAGKNAEVAAAKQKESAAKVVAAEKALKQAKESGKASAAQLATAERQVAEAKRADWKASQELKEAQLGLTKATLAGKEAALAQSSAVGRASAFYKKNRQDIDAVGSALTVVGVAGVAALGAITKSAMSWESAWAGVTKTVNGSDAEMASLEAGLRGLAKTLPSAHEEIAGVAESAGALGVARKDVLGFTSTMIDLGETTNLTADDAATNIAQIANVMGTLKRDGAEGVERFGASLVALGNDGASTEAEILAMAQRIAGAGATLKASEADVLALANTLASMGVNAELGGGVTTRVLLKMRSAVDEGGKSLQSFADVAGVSAGEFAQKFRSAPMEALDLVAKGIYRVNEAGGNVTATMKDMGVKGTEETQVMLALANSGDLLTKSLELGSRAWEENTALAEEAAKRYQTTEAQMSIAWNNVKDAAIDVGSYVLPILADLASGVANIAKWFSELPEPIKSVITAVGGFGSVAALAAGGGIKLVGSLSDAFLSAKNLSIVAPKTAKGIKSVGVAAGVAAVALTAFMTAASYEGGDATQGINEIEAGLKRIAKGDEWASAEVFKNIDGGSWLEGGKESLQGLLDILSDDSGWTKFNNGFADAITGATAWVGLDTRGTAQKQRDELYAYGEALAQMASTDLPTAVEAFRNLNFEAGNTDESAWKLIETLPGLRDSFVGVADDAGLSTDQATLLDIALGRVAVSTDEVGSSSDDASGSVQSVALSLEEQAEAAQEAFDALMAYSDGVLGLRDAERGFQDAIAKANEVLAKNGEGLDIATEKGRKNQDALDDIARAGLDLVSSAREQGASQDELSGKMQATRDAYIAAATGMGMSKKAAKALADELGLIPANVTTTARVFGLSEAEAAVRSFIQRMEQKRINLQVSAGGSPASSSTAVRRASGGSVFGPGTATSDSIPALLSNGEHVLTAREVQAMGGHGVVERLRALARRGLFPAFASGGVVGDRENDLENARFEVAVAKKALAGVRKAEKKAQKAYDGIDGSKKNRSAKRSAKSALDRAKKETKRIEGVLGSLTDKRDDLKRQIAELKASRDGLGQDVRRGELDARDGYSLADRLLAASKDSNLSKKRRKSSAEEAAKAEPAIRKLQVQLEAAEKNSERIAGHVGEIDQAASGIASSFKKGFSFESGFTKTQKSDAFGNVFDGSTGFSAKGVLQGNQDLFAKYTRFEKALSGLASKGVPSSMLQQIAGLADSDIDQALTVAEGLNSSGKTLTDIVKVRQKIDVMSGRIGAAATRNYMTEDGTFYKDAHAVTAAQNAARLQLVGVKTSLDSWGLKITQILGKAYGLKGYAAGGYTGDLPTSAVAGVTHGREFVMNASTTAKYRPVLEAMHAGTYRPQAVAAAPVVNVQVDKRVFEGMAMTLMVDGKPMQAVIRSEVSSLVSSAARGY